jgi:hypothetical protein
MTLPHERTRSVIQTEQFLRELVDAHATPRVPRAVRQRARDLLTHYPCKYLMNVAAQQEPDQLLQTRVFGEVE